MKKNRSRISKVSSNHSTSDYPAESNATIPKKSESSSSTSKEGEFKGEIKATSPLGSDLPRRDDQKSAERESSPNRDDLMDDQESII